MSDRHVVVVGGGASGTIAAAHILRDPEPNLHVTILEPAQHLGRGLAYGTDAPSYLLNARARSMSAFDDQPSDLLDWLAANIGSASWADRYIERRLYGRYLGSLLPPAAPGRRRLTHIRAAAVNLVEHADGVRVDLDDGAAVVGQAAVLAIGHGLLAGPPRARQTVPKGDVLILGTGLGMVDEVLGLLDAGHAGHIVALSRRGQLPQPHGARGEMRLDAADVPLGTNLSYLMRWLRAEVRAGAPWGDLVDALRPHVPQVWGSLPLEVRRRFLRHARPWWDSHRHRMAPSIAERIAAAREEGRLSVVAGRVIDTAATPRGTTVAWRRRGGVDCREDCFAEVVACTGPRCGPVAGDPLLRSLILAGAVRADPLGIGIEVTPALAVARGSHPSPLRRVFAVGPITCPLAWETYAIPEIRKQCAAVAETLAAASSHGRGGWRVDAMQGQEERPRATSRHVSKILLRKLRIELSFDLTRDLASLSGERIACGAASGLHRGLVVRQPTGRGSRLLGGRGCPGRQRWRRAPRRHLQQQLRRRWRRNHWRLC